MNSNFWKDKKILITGHTGFKGTWLSAILKNFHSDVYGFSNSLMKESNLFYDYHKNSTESKSIIGDINDQEFLSKNINTIEPEIVFHLAAQPLVLEGYRNPLETWRTNVIGTLNLLESLRYVKKKCIVIVITTDKVYANKEWEFNYRESDNLGGIDPYSSSKAACEIAVKSWRESYLGSLSHQNSYLKIATARAGNVIGGGDWSPNRLVPDVIKSFINKSNLVLRNPLSTRPWQHVLDPLNGYLSLAEYIWSNEEYISSFNFGPNQKDIKTVKEVVSKIENIWGEKLQIEFEKSDFHEARFLGLCIDRASKILSLEPKWNCEQSIEQSVIWYKNVLKGSNIKEEMNKSINKFFSE